MSGSCDPRAYQVEPIHGSPGCFQAGRGLNGVNNVRGVSESVGDRFLPRLNEKLKPIYTIDSMTAHLYSIQSLFLNCSPKI